MRALLRDVEFTLRLTRLCWRFLRGRWFIYRDEPTWFVQTMANQPIEEVHNYDHADSLRLLIRGARDEIRLRERRK